MLILPVPLIFFIFNWDLCCQKKEMTRQLKIAMLSIHSCPIGELGAKDTGGMNVYIRELARKLGRRGHQIDIYTRFHNPKDSQVIELEKNVRLIHLKSGTIGNIHKLEIYPYLDEFLYEIEKFRKCQDFHYDLVHSHYWLSGRVGKWLQDSLNVPHIMMFHTLGAIKNSTGVGEEEPELRIATEKQLIKSCDRIIASTEREKHELVHFYDAFPETIEVIPCGVNLDLFQPMDKVYARQQLNMDHNEGLVLYVGRFAPLKGINRLLEAMTYLQHINRRIRLFIIGGDSHNEPEFQKLQRLTKELDLQDTVTFVGRIEQTDIPTYYSAADLLVVPSYHESFGLVALESLACGTPVVGTNVGALESIVREGETGSVLPNATPGLLANKIEEFILKAHTNKQSAFYFRESVVRFSWSNIADAMENEYEAIISQRSFIGSKIPFKAAF